MRSILLINPPRSLYDGNVWKEISSCTPPFGLALLASILDEVGIRNEVLDCDAEKLTLNEIIGFIGKHKFDCVGITSTTVTIQVATELAAEVKNVFPDIKIIFGGVHPTIFHEALIKEPYVDFVIRNEGEASLLLLMQSQSLDAIPNLSYKQGGQVYHNPANPVFYDLSRQPFLAYHKLPMDRYYSALGSYKRKPSIGMITSRGCPGKCTFCYSGSNKEMFGKRIRYLPARRIVDEIRYLIKHYNIREISFYDDTFTAQRKNVIAFCNLLLDEQVDIKWSCFARVDTVNAELLTLMYQAGCHQVMYGLESGCPETLQSLDKRTDVNKNRRAVEMTRKVGIDVRGAFMLGSPNETAEAIMATIRYAISLKVDIAIFNITTPFPGTKLYAWAKKNETLLTEDWSKYDLSTPILKLETVTPEKLSDYYQMAYRKFFFRIGYFLQRLSRIKTVEDLKMNFQAFFSLLGI